MTGGLDENGNARARMHVRLLLELTSRLSEPLSSEEVAQVVIDRAVAAIGAAAALMWTAEESASHARLVRSQGCAPDVQARYARIPLEAWLPMGDAIVRREALFLQSRVDYSTRYPLAQSRHDDASSNDLSFACLPLVVHGRGIGGVSVIFPDAREFDHDERHFLTVLAHHAAQALERANLFERERATRSQLERVLDSLPVGVILARPPNAELVLSNAAMARVWRADRCDDGAPRMRRACLPDGSPVAHEDWPLMRALGGEEVESQELRIERDDGTEGWVEVRAAPIRRDDGTIEAAVAATVDVTAEKAARAAADEASRAKDEFLAMLGHELRNPLAPIVTALQLMRMQGGGAFERERAVIERQVSHLVRLVDDLLDVSRAVRGELRLERAPVEVAAVVARAVEVAGPFVEERRHRLTVSVPQTGLVLHADAERIAQVLTNLLTNAAKYTPSGGSINVRARADSADVVIEVADDGVGIGPELLPVVFEAFTQGRQGLDRKEGGLGLGLAIARQLIVAHGGTIEARSAGPGRGTTIIVRLPRADGPPSSGKRARAAALAGALPVPRRVLLVDDNPDAIKLLHAVLTHMGHEVRAAADAPSALQLLQSFSPDIAFLDVGLPVMDGYELARHLRRTPRFAATPLVAVTGYVQDDDRRRALASGFDEHLSKPLELARVLECIDKLCAERSP
jgi:signal transduction histidine kinase